MHLGSLLTDLQQALALLPWHWMAAALHLLLAPFSVLHALLYKRDPRAALGWVSVSLLFPLVGPLLYFIFGINRVQTQAQKLQPARHFKLRVGYESGNLGHQVQSHLNDELADELQKFTRITDQVSAKPMIGGNHVQMLQNGEEAYPAMLAAVDAAQHYIMLATYLFEADEVGRAFVDALAAARRRGVDVYVILDGIGELYSWPRVRWRLRRAGVKVARFLPAKLLPPSVFVNLRNHRKILVVDGLQAFTGGMNIGARHLVERGADANTAADVHFCISGPVVSQLQAVFADDWSFASRHRLSLPAVTPLATGSSDCRCISDGPNADLDKIGLVLMGAISAARRTVVIVTPYFLPSREMIATLQAAALRGVHVSIILPERSNLRYVDWATRNMLWQLLQYRIHVYYQPPPFAHTKLFLVDGVYAQIGSANWDARSLRLNFELNMEIVSSALLKRMQGYVSTILERSRVVTLDEIMGRRLPARIRDALFWLFTPYL